MLDQYMLIRWVDDNIRAFGGDPHKITLFGPGSGASSAGLLALSPLTRKYVKRVIASDGSAVAPWATINNPYLIENMSRVVGDAFGCRSPFTIHLVDCLKSRSSFDIPGVSLKPDVGWLPFAPVLDSATVRDGLVFLPRTPKEILDKGFPANDIHFDAYMTGITRDSGSSRVRFDDDLLKKTYRVSKEDFDTRVAQYLKVFNATLNPEGFKNAIKFMYTPWSDENNETLIRQGLVNVSFS